MITGELKDWWFNPAWNVYIGRVFNDVKCRFRDGSQIHTSEVVREDKSNDVIIVHTLNSIYLLRMENKRCESQPPPPTTT
jgi:hypothetical protein